MPILSTRLTLLIVPLGCAALSGGQLSSTPFGSQLSSTPFGSQLSSTPSGSQLSSIRIPRRAALMAGAVSLRGAASPAVAETLGAKKVNLSPEEIGAIVKKDLVERQFLATADFTREIYDERATFTDEIDTYTLPSFIKGTSALFVAEKSVVKLVGEVESTPSKVQFRFDEDLCFNIPFKPVVTVTGRCELTRDPESGLIIKYREYWDKSPTEVVLTAFQKKPSR